MAGADTPVIQNALSTDPSSVLQPLLKASELLLSNETEDPYAYDTSILWRKKMTKNVRFNLDEEPSVLESSPKPSLTELSPTSVDEIFKTEEVEPIQFLEINKEWIETELIPLFKSGSNAPQRTHPKGTQCKFIHIILYFISR